MFFLPLLFGIAFTVWYYWDRWYRSAQISIDSKYVLITGTDTGFGRALALKLDKLGFNVFAACYTAAGEDDLKKQASKKLTTLRLDITDKSSVQKARAFVDQNLPTGKGLWGLVNNAGIMGDVFFDFSNVDDYRTVMEINFFGPLTVTQTFQDLVKKERGRITTVISIVGRCSIALVPYTTTKFALEPYCDGLRRSMKTFGVHSSIIEPGFHPTTQFAAPDTFYPALDRKWKSLPEETRQEYGEEYFETAKKSFGYTLKLFPLAFLNDPENVADAMVHSLTSTRPKSRYLVGYDARLTVLICQLLPDFISDPIIRFCLRYSLVKAAVKS